MKEMKEMKELKLRFHTKNLKDTAIALAIQFAVVSQRKGLTPREAFDEYNIFLPSDISDDWKLFDFSQLLNIDRLELQKIELINEISLMEEEGKNVK